MNQSNSKDVFAIVTNTIISKLEKGILPWKQPWKNVGPPRNLITQRPYRGVNYLLLNALGFPQNEFLTFKQVKNLGGKVKKGEKAHLIVLWARMDMQGNRVDWNFTGENRIMLRYYYVFNVSQCTDIPEPANSPQKKRNDPVEACEHIVEAMPNKPKIVHNEYDAYYHIPADFINVPKMESFDTSEGYYATLFHELIHATGHEDRLNRKELTEMARFGTQTYSIEELTAEIGSCFLSSYAGIYANTANNSLAYIQGWLDRLKKDKKFVVYASAHAQRAVDYILDIKHEDNDAVSHIQNEEPCQETANAS